MGDTKHGCDRAGGRVTTPTIDLIKSERYRASSPGAIPAVAETHKGDDPADVLKFRSTGDLPRSRAVADR